MVLLNAVLISLSVWEVLLTLLSSKFMLFSPSQQGCQLEE